MMNIFLPDFIFAFLMVTQWEWINQSLLDAFLILLFCFVRITLNIDSLLPVTIEVITVKMSSV